MEINIKKSFLLDSLIKPNKSKASSLTCICVTRDIISFNLKFLMEDVDILTFNPRPPNSIITNPSFKEISFPLICDIIAVLFNSIKCYSYLQNKSQLPWHLLYLLDGEAHLTLKYLLP